MNRFQLPRRHMSRQHLSWQHLSISGISQLLLSQFRPNFKSRFLGLSGTEVNFHSNICPSNICPYQEYLSCYLPNFDPTLNVGFWNHLQQMPTVTVTFVQATFIKATFVLATFVHNQEYLSCYWPNFDQTSKVDCWDHLEMIPTVMAPFVQAIFVHIRNISAVIDPILAKLFGP